MEQQLFAEFMQNVPNTAIIVAGVAAMAIVGWIISLIESAKR